MRAVVESGKVATPCPSCLPRCHVLPLPVLLLLFYLLLSSSRLYTHSEPEFCLYFFNFLVSAVCFREWFVR